MASIYRDTERSPNWIACFKGPDGRQMQRSTHLENKKDAQAMADQLELAAEKAGKGELVAKTVRDIINEIQVKAGCSPFQDVSTEGWFRSWLRNKRSSTAESSQLRYTATIDEFLEFIGKRALKSIQLLSVEDIIEFRDYLEASGIAAKSVRMALKGFQVRWHDLEAAKGNPRDGNRTGSE